MSSVARRRGVSVIVPVYGDLPSLMRCVGSLRRNVDLTLDTVLLVNDSGPEANAIERVLLAAIDRVPGFRYQRNDSNLGFVGTCNRAVLELDATSNDILLLNSDTVTTPGFVDELSAVLHAHHSHGIVCARSNNATIASLPYRLLDPHAPRTAERTEVVHSIMHDRLPRFSVVPVAMGFCFLVRRELIEAHGLFDEAFAPGYGEENDFCLRMRELGYSSLMAHRALVFHEGAKSFTHSRRQRLRAAHERILLKRYPHYASDVQRYLRREIDPVDVFADALATRESHVRILVDCVGVPTAEDDALIDGLAALERLACVTIGVPQRAVERTRRRYPDVEVVSPEGMLRVWDVVVATGTPDVTQLDRMTQASPRLVTRACTPEGLVEFAHADVADQQLRSAWTANAARATDAGLPLFPKVPFGRRIVLMLDARAPRMAPALRRLARAVRGSISADRAGS